MKSKKTIFGLIVMVAGLMASCNQDNVGATYTPTTQNISFEIEKPDQILAKGASIEIPIRVIRG